MWAERDKHDDRWKPPETAVIAGHTFQKKGEYRMTCPIEYLYVCDRCSARAWLVGIPPLVTADAMRMYGTPWSVIPERVEAFEKARRDYPPVPTEDRWHTDDRAPVETCSAATWSW